MYKITVPHLNFVYFSPKHYKLTKMERNLNIFTANIKARDVIKRNLPACADVGDHYDL